MLFNVMITAKSMLKYKLLHFLRVKNFPEFQENSRFMGNPE